MIEYDTIDGGTLTLVDTTSIGNSPAGGISYFFDNVPAGSYLVKAALSENSIGYENYLPTYHGDVLFWDDATYVDVPYDFFSADIHLIPGENPGGPGFIGGLVIEGANFTGFADTRDGEGDPIANVQVIFCLLYTSPSPRDATLSRMPSSA